MTAGEGEFLGLDRSAAARRISEGRSLIEDITGRPIAGFVAPAWLYGRRRHGSAWRLPIAIAEDHLRVWSPASGEQLARGPVITWASRTRPRLVSSLVGSSRASPRTAQGPARRRAPARHSSPSAGAEHQATSPAPQETDARRHTPICWQASAGANTNIRAQPRLRAAWRNNIPDPMRSRASPASSPARPSRFLRPSSTCPALRQG